MASGAVFLGLFTMWLAADALLHVDRFGSRPGQEFLRILLRALDQVPFGVPLSCMVGVIWSLTRAVRYRELTAIRSGGIPLRSALLPILVASLLIAAGIAWVEDRVLVPARESAGVLELELEEGPRHLPRFLNDRWWYATGQAVLTASSYRASDRALVDVTMFEFDAGGRVARRVDAREALAVSGTEWRFDEAQVVRFANEGIEVASAAELRIDLGISGADLERAYPGTEVLSLHTLTRRIRKHSGGLESLAPLLVALHARIAQPLSVLILVLFAIPFAVGDVERGDSLARALLWSLGVGVVYFTSWTLALLAGGSGAVPPAVPLWGVTALFLLAGVWRFRSISE